MIAGPVDATVVEATLVDGGMLADGAMLAASVAAAVLCAADVLCTADVVCAAVVLLLHAVSSKPVAKHAATAATVCRRRFIMAVSPIDGWLDEQE